MFARGLVLCFRPRLRGSKTTSFAFYGLVSYVFSEKEKCVMTAIALNMDDTLAETDVLMIFDELEVQN